MTAMEKPRRLRRRMSAGVRGVVTFLAKRVKPRPPAHPGTVWLPLLQTPVRVSVFSARLPAVLALFTTLLTLLVGWSIAARLPTVFADTKSIIGQIRELEEKVHPRTKTLEQQESREEAILELHDRDNKVKQEQTRLNAKVAALKDDLEAARKREHDLHEQDAAKREALERHRKNLSEQLGREIRIQPGPPLHYDAGPEPKPPWYLGESVGYLASNNYRRRWNAWRKAKEACDGFNTFQQATGTELVEIQGAVESMNRQIEGFNEKLTGLSRQAVDVARQLEQYQAAPRLVWEQLDEKRKQLARTSFARWVFLLLDIPTLLSCLLTMAVAWSRMALIAGRYSPRQLTRSP